MRNRHQLRNPVRINNEIWHHVLTRKWHILVSIRDPNRPLMSISQSKLVPGLQAVVLSKFQVLLVRPIVSV